MVGGVRIREREKTKSEAEAEKQTQRQSFLCLFMCEREKIQYFREMMVIYEHPWGGVRDNMSRIIFIKHSPQLCRCGGFKWQNKKKN